MHMLGLGLFGQQGGAVMSPGDLTLQDPEGTWKYQADPWGDMFGLGATQDGLLSEGTYSEPSYTPVMPGEAGMGPGGGVGFNVPGFQPPPQKSSQSVSRGTFDANPWQLALLAAGSELLKSSNWSRYPQSLGAGLGAAGQAGVGTYLGAKRAQDQSTLAREQIEAMRGTRAAQIEAAKALAEERRNTVARKQLQEELTTKLFAARNRMVDPNVADELKLEAKAEYDNILAQLIAMDKPEKLWEERNPTKDTALENKIAIMEQQLVSEGMSPTKAKQAASNIATGRWRLDRHPISGVAQIVDMASGKLIYGAPTAAAAPQTMQTAMPEGTQAEESLGLSGKLKNWANTVSDAVGMGLAYPKAREAEIALNNLKQQTIAIAQVAVPGRPSNFAMQLVERGMTVDPNSVFMGSDTARLKLQQTASWIETELDRMQRDILSREEQFRPEQVAMARANYSQMTQLLAEYQRLLTNFGQGRKRKPLEEIF
jgi:hypothetical protein